MRETWRKPQFRLSKFAKANNKEMYQVNRRMSHTAAYRPILLIGSGMKHEFQTAKSGHAPHQRLNYKNFAIYDCATYTAATRIWIPMAHRTTTETTELMTTIRTWNSTPAQNCNVPTWLWLRMRLRFESLAIRPMQILLVHRHEPTESNNTVKE